MRAVSGRPGRLFCPQMTIVPFAPHSRGKAASMTSALPSRGHSRWVTMWRSGADSQNGPCARMMATISSSRSRQRRQ